MAIRKIFFLLAIFVFSCSIPSFSTAEERPFSLNFWPLFQYTSDPIERTKEIEGLGPFFLWKKDLHRKEWGIRPLSYWTGDDKEPLWRLEFFYPFGKYEVKEGDKKGYLALLSLFREETFDGKKKWDFQFFPFFIGETVKGEDYFGLFPFFGTLLDRYGKDKIRFYLWPLYGESTSEGVRTTNLLWPFFSFLEGEKKKGYRFWPFYGRREEFGISRSEFFLWPIFLKQTKGLDTDDPVDDWMIFPFYILKESKHFESRTYLWPFFSHARDRLTGFEQWDLPWPFFQSLKGENLYGLKFFPFYGFKEKEGQLKRVFVLYPLYQLEEDRIGDVQEKTHRILLLSRIRTGEDQQGSKKRIPFEFGHFLSMKEGKQVIRDSLFSISSHSKMRGLREIGSHSFVYSVGRKITKGISANLFWGFYKRVKKEGTDSWEVAHLVGLKRGKGWKTLSFLKGLFQYQSDGKTADLRFFYLPFHLRWSHRNPPTSFSKGGR